MSIWLHCCVIANHGAMHHAESVWCSQETREEWKAGFSSKALLKHVLVGQKISPCCSSEKVYCLHPVLQAEGKFLNTWTSEEYLSKPHLIADIIQRMRGRKQKKMTRISVPNESLLVKQQPSQHYTKYLRREVLKFTSLI